MGVIRPGLPPSDVADQVLKSQGPGKRPKWGDSKQLFRGDWSPVGEVAFYDFVSGDTTPGPSTLPAQQAVAVVDTAPLATFGGTLPTSSKCLRLNSTGNASSPNVQWQLNLADFGKPVDRVTFKYRSSGEVSGSGTPYDYLRIHVNGVVVATAPGENTPWYTFDQPLTEDDVLLLQYTGDSSVAEGSQSGYVTDILVAGPPDPDQQPYAVGEFVTYDGRMWKNAVDDNRSKPGVDGWDEVLELPQHVGTTAERPTPATAGAGYDYFDTTLNRPIWVNTTADGWVDATGTAVV